MKVKIFLIVLALALATGAALILAAPSKATICHRPPGNTANAHTLSVGSDAVPAHLAHGDTLGACPASPSS